MKAFKVFRLAHRLINTFIKFPYSTKRFMEPTQNTEVPPVGQDIAQPPLVNPIPEGEGQKPEPVEKKKKEKKPKAEKVEEKKEEEKQF